MQATSSSIRPAVTKQWGLLNPSQDGTVQSGIMMSDGTVELVLVRAGTMTVTFGLNTYSCLPGIYLAGQLCTTAQITLSAGARVEFFKLAPWANRSVAGADIVRYNDAITPLEGVNKDLAHCLRALVTQSGSENVSGFIDDWVTPSSEALAADYTCMLLNDAAYAFKPVKLQVLRELGCSARTLEASFRRNIGLAPKQYTLRKQLRGAVEALLYAPQQSLTDVTYKFGFYDQSHFIRTFRRFFSVAPSKVAWGNYFIPNSAEDLRYYTI